MWVMIGYIARLVFQLAVFFLLSQKLGADGFGAFVGVLALVGLISPFVEWGGYSLIISDIKSNISIPRAFGNSLFLSIFTIPIGILILMILRTFTLPSQQWFFVLCIGLGQFLGGRISILVSSIHTADNNNWRNVVLEMFIGIGMLICALVLIKNSYVSTMWGILYVVINLIFSAFSVIWTIYSYGFPTINFQQIKARLQPGFHFSIAVSAHNAYTDLDKVMLVRLNSERATGIYAAAFRLVSVAYLPLNAILNTTYPKFFLNQQNSFSEIRFWAYRVAFWGLAYGFLVTVLLWLISPVLPNLIGSQYRDSVDALRILSFTIPLQGLAYPFGNVLTGVGRQDLRTYIQIGVLVLNFVLGIIFIPFYGWLGASWSTIITQIALCGSFVWTVQKLKNVDHAKVTI